MRHNGPRKGLFVSKTLVYQALIKLIFSFTPASFTYDF